MKGFIRSHQHSTISSSRDTMRSSTVLSESPPRLKPAWITGSDESAKSFQSSSSIVRCR